jgi:hypothetical protein
VSGPGFRRGLALAVTLAVLPGALPSPVGAQDEPPPWESGDAPPWESGEVPLPPGEGEGPDGEAAEDETPELELPPPGVDTERPYGGRTGEMDTSSLDDLGLELVERNDTLWTRIPFDARGPVLYGAAGFEAGGGLGHVVLTMAGGYTVAGEWQALRAEGERPRLEGRATHIMLSMDVAPGVTADAQASFITIGARAQQVFGFGEHLINLQLALGGRKDLGTNLGGVDLGFGIGYAHARAPFAIPFQLELVRHFSGVFGREWGARLSVGWPFSF